MTLKSDKYLKIQPERYNLSEYKELLELGWTNVTMHWQRTEGSITIGNNSHICPGTTYDQTKDTDNTLTIKFPHILKGNLLHDRSFNQKIIYKHKGKHFLDFYKAAFKFIKDNFNTEYQHLCLQKRVDEYLEFKRQFEIRGYVYVKDMIKESKYGIAYEYVKAYETPNTNYLEWYRIIAEKLYFNGRFETIVQKNMNITAIILNDNILDVAIDELFQRINIKEYNDSIEPQCIEIGIAVINLEIHFGAKKYNVPRRLLNNRHIYNLDRFKNYYARKLNSIKKDVDEILGKSPTCHTFHILYPIYNRLEITLDPKYKHFLRASNYNMFK